jgi:hypothetical protein
MTNVLVCLSIAGLAVCVVAFLVLHVLAADLSPVERTLSEYALTPYRWLYSVAVGAVALAAVSLAVGLSTAPRVGVPVTATVLLGLFAAAMVVAAVFRTDAMDPHATDFTMTRSGVVHAFAGFAASVALCSAAPLVDGSLASSPREWTTLSPWAPTAGLAVFLFTVVARGPLHRLTGRVSVHGIGERVGFVAFIAWLGHAVVSLILAT